MLLPSNRIILVDDNENDLTKLSTVFYENGIGCRKLKYDSMYNEPLTGVRIAFFDINLGGYADETSRNANLKSAISSYISKDNGCFILVFWTSRIEWIDSFIDFINRDEDEMKAYIHPYHITHIDKSEFLDRRKSLQDKLEEIYNLPSVKILFEFENLILEESWNTLTRLVDIIPHEEKWGDSSLFEQNCKSVFASIACQNSGFNNAKENPDRSIKEAIIPMLDDGLRKSDKILWKEFLTNLSNASRQDAISFPKDFSVERLNTVFHIDNTHPTEKKHRGAICAVNCTKNKSCDIFIDCFSINYCEWFNITLPKLTKEDRNNCRLICLELSASCDFTNNKKRTIRYLLGVICPQNLREKLESNKSSIGDYLLILPFDFEYNDANIFLCFNMNYIFTLNQDNESVVLQEPLFYLKKEIVDYIGNRFAQHSSRIGITSFK